MGFISKIKETYNCDICGKTENKWLMFTLTDGRICHDCFNKLGKGKYTQKYSLNEAKEKISNDDNHAKKYNPRASMYKMDTLEEIESIPVPTEKFEYNCDFTESIEYVLQRKATKFKKAGNMECAIACLKKSNEIMPFAPMMYTMNDYERLEKYLKIAGRFEEAQSVEKENVLLREDDELTGKSYILNNAKLLGTDLLEADYFEPASDTEAMYRGRIFCISGKDRRFPVLPEDIWETRLSLSPFIYGVSEPLYCSKSQLISFSNRPFVDDRSAAEKTAFDEILTETLRKAKNEKEYYWILENLPDIAPKSLSGYSRMKNSNSKNFQKLQKAAKEKGYEIQ